LRRLDGDILIFTNPGSGFGIIGIFCGLRRRLRWDVGGIAESGADGLGFMILFLTEIHRGFIRVTQRGKCNILCPLC
jgi:hypothetical protein